jgi:transposase
MKRELLPNDLWEMCEPLLPVEKAKPKGGRPPVANRKALLGILFVLKTGIQWEDLPSEVFGCCGMTCWRRLRDWSSVGVWDRLQQLLLSRLHRADLIDWRRAVTDSVRVRAKKKDSSPDRIRSTGARLALGSC